MNANDWIWTSPCLLAALGLAAWIWRAAGDDRDLEAEPDPQLLLAIAQHHAGPDVARLARAAA